MARRCLICGIFTHAVARLRRRVYAEIGLVGLCVEHGKGLVLVGECSFRLQVAGRHRQESTFAMGEFIDRLKQDVPIWKTAVD